MTKTTNPDWCDGIKIHPAADLFPMMSDSELDDLSKDIEANGLQSQIGWLDTPSGLVLLDGRNRVAAISRIVDENRRADLHEQAQRSRNIITGVDPIAYIISTNIHRRHLTAKARRQVISELVKAHPEQSDRSIAKLVGGSPTTVGTARREANVQSGHNPAERQELSGRKARGHKPGTTADVEPATTEVALDGVMLPTPIEAQQLSRDAGDADAVGSEDQTVLTEEQQQLKDDWFALKDRLLGWSELDVTPDRALAAIPAGQNERISVELRAGIAWLSRLEELCQHSGEPVQQQSADGATPTPDPKAAARPDPQNGLSRAMNAVGRQLRAAAAERARGEKML